MYALATNKRTERRYLVVFPRTPQRPEISVCADFDALPAAFRDPIEKLLKTGAFDHESVGDVLSKHALPGSNRTLLVELHTRGLLFTCPSADLLFTKTDGGQAKRVPFSEVVEQIPKSGWEIVGNPEHYNATMVMANTARTVEPQASAEVPVAEATKRGVVDLAVPAEGLTMPPVGTTAPVGPAVSSPVRTPASPGTDALEKKLDQVLDALNILARIVAEKSETKED